jgi:hypothetical protein
LLDANQGTPEPSPNYRALNALGRTASECMFLSGLYGPPDPPMAQAYGMWLSMELYSFCFWAFDQFCLNT